MKRWVVAACVCTVALFGQEFKLGSAVSDFSVQDLKGNPVQYSTLKGDVTVVAFIATQCPVSNAYNERMKALYNDYSGKGVKFVFLNANRTEPAGDVARHAQENGFPFAVYKDEGQVVTDRFGATVTPEVFVIDRSGVVRYHGSIDDAQNPARVQMQRLRVALDSMLAGKPPEPAETKAFGCTIKRAPKS